VRRPTLVLVLANVASILAAWAIAFVPLHGEPAPGLAAVHRAWDGPPYVVVAKSLYDPSSEVWEHYGKKFGLDEFSARSHATILAVYPLTIRALSPVFGYFNGMLVATIVFSSLCVVVVYRIFVEFRMVADPFWSSLAFVFFPARWLIYHSIGATEPPFLLFILCSFYFYRKRRFALVALFGALAAVTRIYGVLLFVAYLAAEIDRARRGASGEDATVRGPDAALGTRSLWLLVIPAALALHFAFFAARLGDFWAYFRVNAEQMSPIPFLGIFRNAFSDPPTAYGSALLLAAVFYGLVWQWREGHRDIVFLSLAFVVPNLFTLLADLSRFLVPVYPFLLFAPFDALWRRREAKWAFALALPVTYAYAWASLRSNALNPVVYDSLREYLARAQ